MSYDIKCEDLAREFLQDQDATYRTEENIAALAQEIQDVIEEWLNAHAGD